MIKDKKGIPIIKGDVLKVLIFLYPKIKQGVETTLVSPTAKKMVDVVNLYLDKQIKELK